ncbi:MAG TPA: HNH endonuclease [Patescibacteria group bacterium]|nr:HNH endonuclease [Patescibacteria group bacterium]
MKLTFDLLPDTTWNNNIRNMMGVSEWDKLRKKVYKLYKLQCGICKTKRKLQCHEIWKFDDEDHTQTLTGFIALCELCHAIKHIGFAKIQSDRGDIDWEVLVKHYCTVNKCRKEFFKSDYQKALKMFERRSKYDWVVKIGDLKLSEI